MTLGNSDRPYEAATDFDAFQLELPLDAGLLDGAVHTHNGRIEWRCPERVLTEYLGAIGVSQPSFVTGQLLDEFGSVPDLLSASWWRLRRVVGSRLASMIRASNELMHVALAEPMVRGPIVPRSLELVSFLQLHMGFLQHERLIALYVDSRQRLMLIEKISDGGIRDTSVDYRKIIDCGLRVGASGFLLVHNHPSGLPKPSQQDLHVTSRLKALAAELDLHLLDHLIIARGRFGSLDDFWREAEWARGRS